MEGASSQGKTPMVQPATPSVMLAIGIKSQDGDELYYRYPSDKKIKKLLMAYCEDKNMEYETVAFLFDGQRITSTMTLTEIGIKDRDEIDAMLHHQGGGAQISSSRGKTPTVQPAADPDFKLVIGIESQDGEESTFRYPSNKKLQKLFMAYCKYKKMEYKTVAFVYDGKRIQSTMTPAEIGIEDGDTIQAMVHQLGS